MNTIAKMSREDANPRVVEMFDRISGTYDRLNRLFSLGVDRLWRKKAVQALQLEPGMKLLDCSAGTGDMSFEAHRQCSGIVTTLYDPSANMLLLAEEKAKQRNTSGVEFVCGAAEAIPMEDESYDRFMVAFGIRNFKSLDQGISELWRVLKPGATGVILEFTPDRSALIDRLFKFYMWWVMRPLGGAISEDRDAYRYLAETIQKFPKSSTLTDTFRRAGFTEVTQHRHSFGIATSFLLTR
ncbi:MAG: bifunctional demethylmenaquinone methyltransferase/2-methoxy-6-polyprenyl-1,4-benzoquinol methylase UbiE [Calditrichaeota bacterium]|nr:bifunctional demethylmenaquinone methyltransferase/2-methoxy-6-polyprenyl-1,4-benzoquinol methylase UbiE [Calditrichota bacterium]MCB9366418.1 bifunctional demethylmenaquinone methyltransferase/2-methoxy-6-polyprenyl-1,4-benzoquinol methylase UbiE [Calditrichota bacterium]